MNLSELAKASPAERLDDALRYLADPWNMERPGYSVLMNTFRKVTLDRQAAEEAVTTLFFTLYGFRRNRIDWDWTPHSKGCLEQFKQEPLNTYGIELAKDLLAGLAS